MGRPTYRLTTNAVGSQTAKKTQPEFPAAAERKFGVFFFQVGESHAIETAQRLGLPPTIVLFSAEFEASLLKGAGFHQVFIHPNMAQHLQKIGGFC